MCAVIISIPEELLDKSKVSYMSMKFHPGGMLTYSVSVHLYDQPQVQEYSADLQEALNTISAKINN